jgi:hypothetical protein
MEVQLPIRSHGYIRRKLWSFWGAVGKGEEGENLAERLGSWLVRSALRRQLREKRRPAVRRRSL